MTRHRQRPWRTTWRVVLAGVLLAGLVLTVPVPTGEAHTCTPDPTVNVRGRLVMPRGSGLVALDLPGRELRTLAIPPAAGVAAGVTRSPDGSLFAVPRFWRPPDHRVGGQDILLVNPDGGTPVAVMERGQPGEVLGSPVWHPDGSLIFERRVLSGSNEPVRIERSRPGEAAQILTEGASFPGVSPDGALLALVRFEDRDRLFIRPMDGGPEQVLVDRPELLSIAFPRFSPDGAWIAFTAAADPGMPTALDRAREMAPAVSGTTSPLLTRLLALGHDLPRFGPSPALAHGIPWDVWLVRPDGSGLRRVTTFADDDSSVAWSPDGRWLVTLSAEAVHVIAVDGSETYCITNEGGYGALEWLP